MILWAGPPLVVRPMSIAMGTWGYTPHKKLFIKREDKEKKELRKKNGQVSEISKIMGTQMPAIKKERDE